MTEAMDLIRALRGRKIIVASVVVLAAIGAILAPVASPKRGAQKRYQASAVITVVTGSQRGQKSVNPSVIALEVTSLDVTKRAAEIIHWSKPVGELLPSVTATVDQKAGTVQIAGKSDKRERAADVANAFATALVDVEFAKNRADYNTKLNDARRRLKPLQIEISKLDGRIAKLPFNGATALRVQRDAKAREYTSVYNEYQDLVSGGPSPTGIAVAQRALLATATTDPRSLGVPSTKKWRLVAAVMLGLILGSVVALVIERFDLRVRSRSQAESGFGLPVLAEVPLLSRFRRRRELTVAAAPRSAVAASYRMVRAGLTLRPRDGSYAVRHPEVIVVTSAGDREGRSSVAVNVATIFAETGEKTIAVSADLRNPTLHLLLGLPAEPGLVQTVEGTCSSDDAVHATQISNLTAVPSGCVSTDPGKLLSGDAARSAMRAFRTGNDVTVIDTPSLLEASDATPLLEEADSVLIAARVGRTKVEEAKRVGEFLRFLGLPVAGVVLIGPRHDRRGLPFVSRRGRAAGRLARSVATSLEAGPWEAQLPSGTAEANGLNDIDGRDPSDEVVESPPPVAVPVETSEGSTEDGDRARVALLFEAGDAPDEELPSRNGESVDVREILSEPPALVDHGGEEALTTAIFVPEAPAEQPDGDQAEPNGSIPVPPVPSGTAEANGLNDIDGRDPSDEVVESPPPVAVAVPVETSEGSTENGDRPRVAFLLEAGDAPDEELPSRNGESVDVREILSEPPALVDHGGEEALTTAIFVPEAPAEQPDGDQAEPNGSIPVPPVPSSIEQDDPSILQGDRGWWHLDVDRYDEDGRA